MSKSSKISKRATKVKMFNPWYLPFIDWSEEQLNTKMCNISINWMRFTFTKRKYRNRSAYHVWKWTLDFCCTDQLYLREPINTKLLGSFGSTQYFYHKVIINHNKLTLLSQYTHLKQTLILDLAYLVEGSKVQLIINAWQTNRETTAPWQPRCKGPVTAAIY